MMESTGRSRTALYGSFKTRRNTPSSPYAHPHLLRKLHMALHRHRRPRAISHLRSSSVGHSRSKASKYRSENGSDAQMRVRIHGCTCLRGSELPDLEGDAGRDPNRLWLWDCAYCCLESESSKAGDAGTDFGTTGTT